MTLSNFIRLLITALLLYSTFIFIFGSLEFKEVLLQIPSEWFIYACFYTFFSHFVLSIRWFYLLKYLKQPIIYIESLKIYLAGLSLMAAPARMGEAIRSYWLLNRHGIPINIGTGITITERIGDLISALILIAFNLKSPRIILLLISIILLLVLLPYIKSSSLNKAFKSIFIRFKLSNLLKSKINLFEEASLSIKNLIKLIKPLPFTISILICSCSWLVESFLLFKTFSLLNVSLSFDQTILIRTLMGIGGVLSLLPGGLLTTETTSIALSIAYGSGRIEAFAATLFIRIYTLFLPSLIGLIAIVSQNDLNTKQKQPIPK